MHTPEIKLNTTCPECGLEYSVMRGGKDELTQFSCQNGHTWNVEALLYPCILWVYEGNGFKAEDCESLEAALRLRRTKYAELPDDEIIITGPQLNI